MRTTRVIAAVAAAGLVLVGATACQNDDATSTDTTTVTTQTTAPTKGQDAPASPKNSREQHTITNPAGPTAGDGAPASSTPAKAKNSDTKPAPKKTESDEPVLVPGNDDPVVGY